MGDVLNKKKKVLLKKFFNNLLKILKIKKLNELPIDYSLSILTSLKKNLSPEPKTTQFPSLSKNPKLVYLWNKINFLETQVIQLIYHREFIESLDWEESKQFGHKMSDQNILRAINDLLEISSRRLIETLLEMKGFQNESDQEVFRLYFCLLEIKKLRRRISHQEKFFSCSSKNYSLQLKFKLEDLKQIKKNLSRTDVFFLQSPESTKLQSLEETFQKVFSLLSKEEKFIIGLSYERFSNLSRSAHKTSPLEDKPLTKDDLKITDTLMSFLLLHCLSVLSSFAPEVENSCLDSVNKFITDNQVVKELFHLLTDKSIEEYDYVSIGTAMGRVTAIKMNRFGYKCYKVKFLTKPFIEDQEEDFFIPRSLQLFQKGSSLRKKKIEDRGVKSKWKVGRKMIQDKLDKEILSLWEQKDLD